MGASDGLTTTETRNPLTVELDQMTVVELLRVMNSEDRKVPDAIARVIPEIAIAVDLVVGALRAGGRLVYLGAGTSGRLGVLDAAECPPTFGTSPDLVVGLLAGGNEAMFHAVEGAEDSEERAVSDLERIGFAAADVLVGIAASGRTPYVIAGLAHARRLGAATVSIACNPGISGESGGAGRHRAGQRPGGAHRFDPPEGGYEPEAGAEHDLDRSDGPSGQGVRQPDGRCDSPPTRSWSTVPCASWRRPPAAQRTRRCGRWTRPTGTPRPRS